jgi:hypothetical protein
MLRFARSLHAWQTDAFARTLKKEIERAGTRALPLEQGTSQGGFVDDAAITATVLSATESRLRVCADVGVFFNEILAGCSCGDEPESINAYCRIRVRIDKSTAQTDVRVIPD